MVTVTERDACSFGRVIYRDRLIIGGIPMTRFIYDAMFDEKLFKRLSSSANAICSTCVQRTTGEVLQELLVLDGQQIIEGIFKEVQPAT